MKDEKERSFFEVTDGAMKHFGLEAQVDKLIEETEEVLKALIKYKECGDIARNHVAEELADFNILSVPIQKEKGIQAAVGEWTRVKVIRLDKMYP